MSVLSPDTHERPAETGDDAMRRARVVGLVAVVLVLVVAVVMTLTLTAGRSDVVGPSNADQQGGIGVSTMTAASASSAHDAAATTPPLQLEVYTDYTDPDSARFASVNALVIQGLAQQGSVSISVHPLAIGEAGSDRDAAIRAANAVACVGEHAPKHLWAFHVGLLAMQPSTATDALVAQDLIALARDSGVHSDDEVSTCIAQGLFAEWVDLESDQAVATGVGAHDVVIDRMPVVLANGTPYSGRIDSSDEFRAFLDEQLSG